jgi:hypothetical protein
MTRLRRSLWPCLKIAALLWVATGSPLVEASDSSTSKEHQVKAGFLYNFTKFVDWRPTAFASAEAPIVIGIYGKSPIEIAVREVVKGRDINGRRFEVREIQSAADAKGVHLLFIPASADSQVGEVLLEVKGLPILTVGETQKFQDSGGIIRFVLEKDKIRFDIAMDAAVGNDVKINAQLQKLARTIKRKE